MSLLEWMMTKVPFYGRILQDEEDELGDYNPLIITKLLKNYRSHPSILEVRSEIFTLASTVYIYYMYVYVNTNLDYRNDWFITLKQNP